MVKIFSKEKGRIDPTETERILPHTTDFRHQGLVMEIMALQMGRADRTCSQIPEEIGST